MAASSDEKIPPQPAVAGPTEQIREVWAENLEAEIQKICEFVNNYQYIAIDTEFPGIVARPTGYANVSEYSYYTVKCNVDLLKVIQLGLTFADAGGNLLSGASTWQFNFFFDLEVDMYAQDSVDFLRLSGINFEKHASNGIDLHQFGELMMGSGLVMNERVKWVSFHGCYDFGYLLKLLTCKPLPHHEPQFFELLDTFFPSLYDIKVLLRDTRCPQFDGGSSLQRVAEHFKLRRHGAQHQAGSDSLLTCKCFFALMRHYFDNRLDDSLYSGVIYGLSPPRHASPPREGSRNSRNRRALAASSSRPRKASSSASGSGKGARDSGESSSGVSSAGGGAVTDSGSGSPNATPSAPTGRSVARPR